MSSIPYWGLPEIIEIAETAQIRYPYDPQTGFPYVMTSDFYIETINGPIVVAIKLSSDLKNSRVREKLEIERRYWRNRNIKWKIVTENEINLPKARSIEWLSQAKKLEDFGVPSDMQASCILYFEKRYTCFMVLDNLFKELEAEFNLDPGVGLNIYKHLAYWKRIEFDAEAFAGYIG